jgi:hypothetical protein
VRACRDRFFHHLPTSLRQWPYAAPGQIPQAFIYVAAIKKNDTFARVRVVKSPAGIFLDQLKERLPPGSTGVIKDFFAKLFEFFNADWSDRFGDRFASFPRAATFFLIINLIGGTYIFRNRHRFFDQDSNVDNDIPAVRKLRMEVVMIPWLVLTGLLVILLINLWRA